MSYKETIVSRLLKVALLVLAAALPVASWAEGKIAVVDLNEAILQTDLAKKRLGEVRGSEQYKADKKEYDKLKAEFDELVKTFQKDSAVMSQDQQSAAREKLRNKQDDLEHVAGKLQKVEQAAGQALLGEMGPRIETVLREMIAQDGIGLLLKSGAVIHNDATYNITAKLTERLNQATKE